jgi:hypothetical protein
MGLSVPGIRCRQINENDIPAVVTLLTRGFPSRSRRFWEHALGQMTRRDPPPQLPKYGYLLETDNKPIGAILTIYAAVRSGTRITTRCNLSSWYVEPEFRAYATMLTSQALKHKDVTCINVSAAPHTWPIIEAQGFTRYSDGIFIACPALNGLFSGEPVEVFSAEQKPSVPFDPFDQGILLQHAALGCLSLWCATAERAYPFVFRPRAVKHVMPCAQLIYCSDVKDFVRFAGPIGRYLALRGRPIVIVDANAPIPGLFGVFRGGKMPKYFKGPQQPRLGDLAYTEYAVLGV